MKKIMIVVVWLVGMGWISVNTTSHAQLPPTAEQRRKQAQMRRQMNCLQRCETQAFRSFYQCGPDGSRYDKASASVYFRDCIGRCHVTWFCHGYRQSVRDRCPTMCLQQHKKKSPKKTWKYRPTRKQYQQWLRKYERWEIRTRFACRRICGDYSMICNIQETVVLPPKTKLPKFESLP